MGAVRQKLKSRRGASIILALMFFLICAVIGGIVLASASSNAGRLSHMRSEQQAYLTVSSAAKLVSGGLTEMSYEMRSTTVTRTDGGRQYVISGPTLVTVLNSSSPAQGIIEAWANYHAGGLAAYPPAVTSFSIAADGLDTVTATLTMDEFCNISIEFRLAGDERYALILTLPAGDSGGATVGVTENLVDEGSGTAYSLTTSVTTRTITWGNPVITKEVPG